MSKYIPGNQKHLISINTESTDLQIVLCTSLTALRLNGKMDT